MLGLIMAQQRRVQILCLCLLLVLLFTLVLPPLAIRNGAYELFRLAAWQKVRWERRNMEQTSSHLVTVYHDGNDRKSAELVLALFDQYKIEVDNRYQFVNEQPIQVVIHPSRHSLAASMGWASGDSALGVYWGGSIKLLSPSVWLKGKSQAEIERIYRKNGPVVHEYTHLVIDRMTSGNIPRWLTEGLAQVEEQRLTGYLWLEVGSAIKKTNLYPLSEMNSGFDGLENQPLAYHQSYTLARFMVDRIGQERVNQLLRELGNGYTLEQALHTVAEVGLSEFEQNWREWVLEEYTKGAS